MAAQTPKGQPSSRLLTMKFMQRAAATASSPITPKSEDEHSAKRRRTSGKQSPSTPSAPLFDQKAVQAALEDEERKRQAALERQAMELGDSRWVLDVQMPTLKSGRAAQTSLNIVQVGFAQIDSSDTPEETTGQIQGTKSFGPKSKKRKLTEAGNQDDHSDSGTSGSSEEDSDDDTSPARGSLRRQDQQTRDPGESDPRRVKSESKNRQREEQTRAQQFAEKRRKKDVKLNKLTSISSAGGSSQPDWLSRITCHACGKTGHKAGDCPNKRSR